MLKEPITHKTGEVPPYSKSMPFSAKIQTGKVRAKPAHKESDLQKEIVVQAKLSIKPLSVNECWQGRRFKTVEYRIYENAVMFMLKKQKVPKPPYILNLEFGFSNSASDIDNPVKPFQDILQKKYKINDKDIHCLNVRKFKVKKGEEYINFIIKTFE